MQDKIIISELKVYCHHGVYDEEKLLGQNFYVSAEIGVDTYKAGMTDDLNESVNYAHLCYEINDFMQNNRYDLIEAVANKLAVHILCYSELIKSVLLKISKPEAPIGLPFDNVSVEIFRKWHKAYIAFGSNLGSSREIIKNAIEKISVHSAMKLICVSDIIKTKPYGGIEQPDFFNGCLEVETYLSAEILLDELHKIEDEAGRKREIHWGPRTLDLDIIFYDDEVLHTKNLTIPHIDMQNRIFVLEPLNEIAPYAYHPVYKKTVNQLYMDLIKS